MATSIPISHPCPLCSSKKSEPWATATDLEYLTTSEVFQYFKCVDCGCLFIHPVPLEQLSQIYPGNYYSFAGGELSTIDKIKQSLDKSLFKKILSSIPSGDIKVLDIGGGTGWMLDLVRDIDDRVSFTQVVDIDRKAKKLAHEKGHAYFEGPIERFTSKIKFHLVLMFNLIEHVQRPIRVLQKVQNVMAPGGFLLIKTPNIDSLDARLFRHSNWGGYHCPRHWVLFKESSFKHALGNTSLKITFLKYTQGAPFWAQSVMMMLFRRKLIHYTQEQPLVYHPLFPVLASIFAGFDLIRGLFFKTSQMFVLLKNPSTMRGK